MYADTDTGFCRLGNFKEKQDDGTAVINNSDIDWMADYFGTSGNTGQIRQYYYHFDQLGIPTAMLETPRKTQQSPQNPTIPAKPNNPRKTQQPLFNRTSNIENRKL